MTGEEAELMRMYLDEWAVTHHKHRPLSNWIAGLSSWGKDVQVYACTVWLFESIKAWAEFDEPLAWLKPLFAVESTPHIAELSELATRWFTACERRHMEESALHLFETMAPVLEQLTFNLDEYQTGSGDVNLLRNKALRGLDVGLHFCAVLSWTVELDAAQYPTIDQAERDARADAGPVTDSV
ncbi:MAG: hypothetical protein P1V97_29055, partial [Planctomycetota bacterium]|nr:hypothetical protein [Planctomycetota bacterium]